MASLPENLTQALRPLGALTISQKVALGLAALLVLTSLAWLAQWAAEPEMMPLLPGQTLGAEDIERMQSGLEALQVKSKLVGTQILVPVSANRPALLAQLGLNEQLPADISIGFDALIKESNVWLPQEENAKRWTVGQQSELAKVLRSLAGVRDARVFLNINGQRKSFSRNEPPASASVILFMKSGETVPRGLALAAARLVAGAVRGLPLRNVEVLDGSGAVALDHESEQSGSSTHLTRLRREHEQQIAAMIRGQIAFDPELRVSVRVELDTVARELSTSTPVEGVEKRTTERSEESIRGKASEAPGVQPNVGASAGRGGLEERTVTRESDAEFSTGLEQKTERSAPGEIREIFAAINVSYSALASIYRRLNPNATAPPTDQQIEEVFRVQREKIVNQVQKLVKPQLASQVAVDWYLDGIDQVDPAGADDGSASIDPMQIARTYGPPAGLSLLALLALGMTLRMGRTRETTAAGLPIGSPRAVVEAARRGERNSAPDEPVEPAVVKLEPTPLIELAAGEDVLLEGREVDEQTVQIRKMVEQLSQLAEKDVDGVAAMVEKWIDRSR